MWHIVLTVVTLSDILFIFQNGNGFVQPLVIELFQGIPITPQLKNVNTEYEYVSKLPWQWMLKT